jgi:ElaB/YqjD/DUF883 family membrane-anchored ribosome-binding protein
MTARAEHRAHNVLDEAEARIARLRVKAQVRGRALLNQAKGRGGELLEDVQDRGQKALDVSKKWISENPGQTIGIAFAAGAIAYAWFSRSDD